MELQELIDVLVSIRDNHNEQQKIYGEDERSDGGLLKVMMSNNVNEPQNAPFHVFESLSPYHHETFVSIQFISLGLVNWAQPLRREHESK